VLVSDFEFNLPPELIAQHPAPERTRSKLMVLDRGSGRITHTYTADIPAFLSAGDLLVVNDTRVFPARLTGRRLPGGGMVECLLLKRRGHGVWDALVHPGQRLRPGSRMVFERDAVVLHAEIVGRSSYGRRTIQFDIEDEEAFDRAVDRLGEVPLPPYIKREPAGTDTARYQTVYARVRGSVAAPTAGLHFTPELLDQLQARGIGHVALTLHVGYGTFQPVRTELVDEHRLDPEPWSIDADVAAAVNDAVSAGRRVVAVGTTTTRTLEAVAAAHGGRIAPGSGQTDLFIYPGFRFQVVSALLTNFHLPGSSLLMLVAAFAGRERVLEAYRTAIEQRYRFYSYGDAMLIL
jgi:S-adenosylmethionine:tRNA ribosyltransferase-isomerase